MRLALTAIYLCRDAAMAVKIEQCDVIVLGLGAIVCKGHTSYILLRVQLLML